jgi:8-amino-3,8-dideoxy-alpha-D-manno-octulosonate transaminase
MGGSELIGKEEKDALAEVIERGGILLRYGFDEKREGIFKVAAFEKKFARYIGARYTLAVSSGSAAVRVALAALGIGPGDEVITQAFTFVATIEAILEAGATPVIANVDKSLNLDPEDFRTKITGATKAVIPVHMLGVPARMDEIMAVAREHGMPVLEDSCQACGSSYNGRKTGTIGAIGCYSFDYVKTITTGEGGMVVTDDRDLYRRASEFHDHGHAHRVDVPRGEDSHHIAGFNYRMNELQGAIGLVQIGRLDHVLSRQKENKNEIKSALSSRKGIEFRDLPDEEGDGGDTLIFFLKNESEARETETALTGKGIGTKILPSALGWHFAGRWNHLESKIKPEGEKWKKTSELLKRAIAIPISVNMSKEQKQEIIDTLT